MGWFGATRPAEPDPAMGNAAVRALREQLATAHWQPAAQALAAATDPDARAFLVWTLSRWPGRPAWLDEWVEAAPEHPDGYLLRGARGIGWAWEARGTGDADTVSGTAFGTFWERLRVAERDLLTAAELAPGDAAPWAQLLTSARGLQLPPDELWERFDRARERAPLGYAAHAAMLWGLTAKWGGKTDDTLRLAYTASDAAPAGSPLHSLVAEAHVEHTVFLAMEGRADEARWYWQEPRVLSDLRLSAERTRGAAGPFAPRARNVLAYAASRADLRDLAAEQFTALGDLRVEGPYDFAANSARLFAADRKKAGVR